MSTELRRRMIEDMQLRDLTPGTQRRYLGAVRYLAEYYDKSPAKISEEELRDYLLYLKNERQLARKTCMANVCAIKFLYRYTLKRPWPILDQIRFAGERKLPVVLSRAEVRHLLNCFQRLHYRTYFSTVYGCGLRTSEGVNLQVGDIDSDRMLLRVRQGKRRKDRFIPLPGPCLSLLRAYWVTHRNPVWLFPALYGQALRTATKPMSAVGVRTVFQKVLAESGIRKPAQPRSLRHAFATHLRQAGVALEVIQAYLGHRSLNTTAIYTHLTGRPDPLAGNTIEQVLTGVSCPK